MDFLKRIIPVLAVVALLLPARAEAVSTGASAAVLMEAESGRILYQQNIHEPRLIASITKLMTALVATERCEDLSVTITIRPEWTGAEGSSLYLKAGECISLETLLYGLLLQSGNDAAVSLACYAAGSEAAFAELMNEKAAELGMENSSFANASGLNQEGHYSSAYDMAILACACLQNETIAKICATRSITIGNRTFVNHNKLLWLYEGCVGMKTGYTERAGRTLVSAARRDGMTLVCVTLNDGDDWNDHKKLFDYGFENYSRQSLCERDQCFGRVPVSGSLLPSAAILASQGAGYPVLEGEHPEAEIYLSGEIAAPAKAGMRVGSVVWRINGTVITEVPLVLSGGVGLDVVEERTFTDGWKEWIGR